MTGGVRSPIHWSSSEGLRNRLFKCLECRLLKTQQTGTQDRKCLELGGDHVTTVNHWSLTRNYVEVPAGDVSRNYQHYISRGMSEVVYRRFDSYWVTSYWVTWSLCEIATFFFFFFFIIITSCFKCLCSLGL